MDGDLKANADEDWPRDWSPVTAPERERMASCRLLRLHSERTVDALAVLRAGR